tara:strand:+ start:1871 stop:2623 length:753 start_codon:yes stop_codon:yes gene_type:complete
MATENADNKKLFDAINEVRNSEIKAKEIKGKSYLYVKDRNSIFRKHFGLDVSYHSSYELTEPKVFNYVDKKGKEVHKFIPESVIVKTEIFYKNKFLACGLAQEFRDSNHINITSAMENCQTSSLGRALACLDLTGTEFASADEMQIMDRNQGVIDDLETSINSNTDTLEKKDSHIPPRKESSSSPTVSEKEWNRIYSALIETTNLAELGLVFTKNQIPIETDKELKKVYDDQYGLLARNKPQGDDWDEFI